MMVCRNVYGGCVKYLLKNLSVTTFGQFDSEILYNDTQPKYKIEHVTDKIAHITHIKIRQILRRRWTLKIQFTNKTANINGKNSPFYN